ncbi:MAG: PBP1A family penicillin-binding protein [Bdellovibrionales bacterium]
MNSIKSISKKQVIAIVLTTGFLTIAAIATWVIILTSNLPKLISVEDYEPLLVSEVFDRNGEKIGEFFREKRLIADFTEIPPQLVNAFVSAEDSSFYDHNGINYVAILRAMIANIKAGRKVQGASTITQQVARTLILRQREKTYTRKIKEVALAYRMEENLTKQEILYLYLNQIYLGSGAYGVKMAADLYFRKDLKDLTVAECAILAGLPQAPSRYSPILNPQSAKAPQRYVLGRMAQEGYITQAEADTAMNNPIKVYVRKDFRKDAPFYLETVRQMLVTELGEEMVLDKGLRIYTSLDIKNQIEAQKQVRNGLRELDKRQGYLGPIKRLETKEQIAEFLLETRNELMEEHSPVRIIQADGSFPEPGPLNLSGKDENGEPLLGLPEYINLDDIVNGVVTQVDDKWGLVYVRFAEQKGLIDFETMKWARKPNPKVQAAYDEIKKPSEALAVGDVIQVKVVGRKFYSTRLNNELNELKRKLKDKYEHPAGLPEDFKEYTEVLLEQEPETEGALLSFDQTNGDIIAMVGGRDFGTNKFNKTYQALRQTGSSFKVLVYASALDKGFTPATRIIDSPLVFEEEKKIEDSDEVELSKWKPTNYDQKFKGDILFRNALIRSLNIPTVKIIEKVGVDWVANYARRLGIFSPLNMDLTLALGSSSVTLYEMTKVFSQLGRLGKRIVPRLILKVTDADGNVLLENISLDKRFQNELDKINEDFELRRQAYLQWKAKKEKEEAAGQEGQKEAKAESDQRAVAQEEVDKADELNGNPYSKVDFSKQPSFYFSNSDQLIDPRTAYITTSILQGVIEEPGGTGGRARALGRPVAGKTGTTSGYFDAWFVGYTPDVVTGVWVGYEQEKTLGIGEGGGKTALPIWLEYMKFVHEGLPERSFPVPEGITFANIDNETGRPATASSEKFVRQAFLDGTEPKIDPEQNKAGASEDIQDFFKQDLSE